MRLERRHVALAQGLVWTASGLWPLVHYRSFEKVTGPKREPWLVKTVGLLIASLGTALGVAAARRRVTPELALAGALGAASVAGVDLRYALARRISRIYLADVLPELAFVWGWWRTAR